MKINDSGHTFCRLTLLLVVGSTRGEATYGGAGVVAFYFPSVRLCAGGSALRTPKTIPPYSAPATGAKNRTNNYPLNGYN